MDIAEPAQFWANMHQLGIFDDLVSEIAQSVEQFKVRYAARPDMRASSKSCTLPLSSSVNLCFISVADKLSSLSCILNLSERIGDRVHSKRMQAVFESNVLTSELQGSFAL